MRAPGIKRGRRAATLSARLGAHVTLEARADGNILACFGGYSVSFGQFGAGAADGAQELRRGVPLGSFTSERRSVEKEIHLLVRRLARHGLLEYSLGRPHGEDQVVIEPQLPDYWPQTPPLGNADVLVLSRFAYMRRRANEMVLESPRAGALFRICSPKIAAALATLSSPQQVKQLRRRDGFPGLELLALLVDCQILFKVDAARDSGLRPAEGDYNLILWDFHDLLFHTRSTEGRHANPLGGTYPYAGVMAPLPAVRPRWPGKRIHLRKFSPAQPEAISQRRSSCVRATRRAASMIGGQSRSLSFRGFSTAPRVCRRDLAAAPTTAARWWRTRRGRIPRGAAATSSSSIWLSVHAKGWHEDSIITTLGDTP